MACVQRHTPGEDCNSIEGAGDLSHIADCDRHAKDGSSSNLAGIPADECSPDANENVPFVSPIRASFSFDAVEGFGEWQLWLLSRAQKDLRFARKKNPKLFDIIMKKMR